MLRSKTRSTPLKLVVSFATLEEAQKNLLVMLVFAYSARSKNDSFVKSKLSLLFFFSSLNHITSSPAFIR